MHQRFINENFNRIEKSSQSFPFKRIFRKSNFDPGSGGGGGGGVLLLKSKRIFSLCLHFVIVEQLWALNLYNVCPIRVCSYFRQHLPVKDIKQDLKKKNAKLNPKRLFSLFQTNGI